MTPRLLQAPGCEEIGRRWHLFDCLESTNSLALTLLDAETESLVIQAREQTGGRGQHGRTWVSPRNTSILLSVVAFPPPSICRPVYLTAWAALAVCNLIAQEVGLEATIKWPNDVLIDGKKVCGILIEQRRGTVVGIGLNLRQGREALDRAGLTEATSLAIVARRRNFALLPSTTSLLQHLDRIYRRLIEGKMRPLEAEWNRRIGLTGRNVMVECPAETFRGRILTMSFERVTIKMEGGATRSLVPEMIRHLSPTETPE